MTLQDLLLQNFLMEADGKGAGSADTDTDDADTDSDGGAGDKGSGDTTGESAKHWEKRFKGLQRSEAKKTAKIASLREELGQANEDLETERSTSQTLTTERDGFKATADKLEASQSAREKRDTVGTSIRDAVDDKGKPKYPRKLADMFQKGLLPGVEDLDEEARDEYLDNFAKELFGFADEQEEESREGAGANSGGKQHNTGSSAKKRAKLSKDELFNRLRNHPDPSGEEYEELETLYFDLFAKE